MNFFYADLLVVFLLLLSASFKAFKKRRNYIPEDDGIVWNMALAEKMGGR